MDENGTLAHATLHDSLNAACHIVAEAYVTGSRVLNVVIPGIPTSDVVKEYIAGQVFDLAIDAGWLPKSDQPEEGQGVVLGNSYVKEQYRDGFIASLSPSLSNLLKIARRNDEDDCAERIKLEMFGLLFPYLVGEHIRRPNGDSTLAPGSTNATDMPDWAQSLKAKAVLETTTDQRRALERAYLSAHKHPVYEDNYQMQELHWMAAVHRKQWDRWRRGQIANNSEPGRRILALLERNEQARNRKSLKRRSRSL